jgi:hypothetical protein
MERNVFSLDPTELSVRLFESAFHKFLHLVISCNYLASLMLLLLLSLMNDLGNWNSLSTERERERERIVEDCWQSTVQWGHGLGKPITLNDVCLTTSCRGKFNSYFCCGNLSNSLRLECLVDKVVILRLLWISVPLQYFSSLLCPVVLFAVMFSSDTLALRTQPGHKLL